MASTRVAMAPAAKAVGAGEAARPRDRAEPRVAALEVEVAHGGGRIRTIHGLRRREQTPDHARRIRSQSIAQLQRDAEAPANAWDSKGGLNKAMEAKGEDRKKIIQASSAYGLLACVAHEMSPDVLEPSGARMAYAAAGALSSTSDESAKRAYASPDGSSTKRERTGEVSSRIFGRALTWQQAR